MANPHLTVAADDDLPRTFRRDKAEKAAREREAAEAAAAAERQRAEAERGHTFAREGDMPRIFERGGHDRTAHDRSAHERAGERSGERTGEQTGMSASPMDAGRAYPGAPPYARLEEEPQPAVVRALKIPFFHLMLFCLKLTLAAIPALILLAAILYGMGQVLKIYLPWLVQAEILIRFPK